MFINCRAYYPTTLSSIYSLLQVLSYLRPILLMSYTVPPNFVPFSFDVYDNDSVATHSPYPQPFNLEDNQLLNSIDPFVTCLYQATASAQTLPEISMCACDACYMPIGQHFDSSELKLGNLNYGISITEMNESSRLAKGSPYEVPFSSQVSP